MMELVINPAGYIRCLYSEAIELSKLGHTKMRRASHVEPTASGQWIADLAPVNGPILGPFRKRSLALSAESEWLKEHRLYADFSDGGS